MKTEKTKIEFEWDGKKIVLEYTADSLRKMVKRGFDITKAEEELLILVETLFCGAFIANHDDIKETERRAIYKEICENSEDEDGKSDSIDNVIIQMFSEAIDELNSHRGNVKWKVKR